MSRRFRCNGKTAATALLGNPGDQPGGFRVIDKFAQMHGALWERRPRSRSFNPLCDHQLFPLRDFAGDGGRELLWRAAHDFGALIE